MNNKLGLHYGYWTNDWETDIISLINRASSLGLEVLEMNPPSYMMELKKEQMLDLKKHAEEKGIELTFCIGFPKEMDMSSPDKNIRSAGIEYTKRMLEAIHYMGGKMLSGILYSYWPATFQHEISHSDKEAYLERGLKSVKDVITVAEDYNIMYGIEVVNRFEQFMINSTKEGLDFIRKVDSPNCKLLLDVFHMNIEEDNIADALREAGHHLGHLHISENNRKLPGSCRHINWEEVFTALREIDYKERIILEPFVKSGGPVARDIRIWRDLSNHASPEQMDRDLEKSLTFLKELM